MKKIAILFVIGMVALSLSACSNKEKDKVTPEPTNTVTPTNTPEPTDAAEPTDTAEPTGEPSINPEEGTTGEEAVYPDSSTELDEIHAAVKEAYGEKYMPSWKYDKTALTEQFGIKEEWYDKAIAEGPAVSMHVDTFMAFHATEGNLENLKNAMEQYKERLVNDSFQYPFNMPKVQAAKIETSGEYVFFIMLGMVEDTEEMDEQTRIEEFEKLNQLAADAIQSVLNK